MKRGPATLVYIEAARGYYARYVGKACTHKYEVAEGSSVEPYWIEMLRLTPESWDEPTEPEAA